MKSIRDWMFSQLLSKSVVSTRAMSGSDGYLNDENEVLSDKNFEDLANLEGSLFFFGADTDSSLAAPSQQPSLSNENRENLPNMSLQLASVEDSSQSHRRLNRKKMDPVEKVKDLRMKFLQLLKHLGHSQDNLLVSKVLYRIHLATLIKTEDSDLQRLNHSSDKASITVMDKEEHGQPDSSFSFRILVLGKTGVGKSATINSLFNQTRTVTDPFQPATKCIKEVAETVDSIKISIIDTPGFLPSTPVNLRRNKKIMLSVKRYIRKYPPDIVLYFDRLDLVSTYDSEFDLLKLITEVFGPTLWFSTILVMTHSSSALPEGPGGYPISYDSFVAQRTDLIQQHIHQAVSDSRLENPVLLVENHSQCRENFLGEKVLPNGQVWKSQFLLLCICTKVLADVNTLLRFQNSLELGPVTATRLPSLPHLLSSLLRHRGVPNPNGVDYGLEELLSDIKEDEYDELPSIRILTKSQFKKLTSSQQKEYLDELDYRETLFLKKKLKEQYEGRKNKLSKDESLGGENIDDFNDQQASPEAVLLPDMAIPPSFDSDCPVHRYRCLSSGEQWLVRPVLDPQGWDHDVSFDGISLETQTGLSRNCYASLSGQASKDKHSCSFQSECVASYLDSRGTDHSVALDVQSTGKDLIYSLNGHSVLRTLRHNITDCGVSLTSFGNKYYVGAKLEDTILIGKRLKLIINAGRLGGQGQVAYGGSIEANLTGGDYPVRNDNINLTMTILSFEKDTVLSGNLQSEFRLSRNARMSVNANVNSRKMGKVSVRVVSSEHLQVALIAAFTMFKALLRSREIGNTGRE